MKQRTRQEIRASRRTSQRGTKRASQRGAFTLVEIMVALAIFAVMMAIVFVPLNLALQLFHVSQARANVLAATESTLDAMERELRRAVFVFPNEALPGVTDRAPYQNNQNATDGQPINPYGKPYVRVATAGLGVCDTENRTQAEYVDNPARLDFLVPDYYNLATGNEQDQPVTPLRPGPQLISYYPRRLDATKDADPYDNPIMLFRGQIAYRENNGTDVPAGATAVAAGGAPNIELSSGRYPNPTSATTCGTSYTTTTRGAFWLYQLYAATTGPYNEPNLEPLMNVTTATPAQHARMLPRNVALVARRAYNPLPEGTPNPNPDYTPETTFRCADTDGDHTIDQVTITLSLGSYDDAGADRRGGQPVDQRIRLTRTISLPNAR